MKQSGERAAQRSRRGSTAEPETTQRHGLFKDARAATVSSFVLCTVSVSSSSIVLLGVRVLFCSAIVLHRFSRLLTMSDLFL